MARVPQTAAVFRTRGPFEAFAGILRGDLLDEFGLLFHAGLGAVELEEQRGRFTQRQIRVAIDRADGERVDEFDARNRHADLDRFDDRANRVAHRRERAHRRGHRLRLRIQADCDFRNHAERAFRADEQAREVVTRGRLAGPRAGFDHAAVGQHHGQPEHVFAHRAVAHGVGTRRARGRHAADARVRAGVDREEQTRVAQRLVQLFARDAGLDGDGQVFGVDRQHPVHFRQIDRYAALHGEQMPFQRRAVTVRNDRDVVLAAQFDDVLHVFGRACEHDCVGQLRVERRFVAAMMDAHCFGHGHAIGERGLERAQQLGGKRTAQRGRRHGMVHACLLICGAIPVCSKCFILRRSPVGRRWSRSTLL